MDKVKTSRKPLKERIRKRRRDRTKRKDNRIKNGIKKKSITKHNDIKIHRDSKKNQDIKKKRSLRKRNLVGGGSMPEQHKIQTIITARVYKEIMDLKKKASTEKRASESNFKGAPDSDDATPTDAAAEAEAAASEAEAVASEAKAASERATGEDRRELQATAKKLKTDAEEARRVATTTAETAETAEAKRNAAEVAGPQAIKDQATEHPADTNTGDSKDKALLKKAIEFAEGLAKSNTDVDVDVDVDWLEQEFEGDDIRNDFYKFIDICNNDEGSGDYREDDGRLKDFRTYVYRLTNIISGENIPSNDTCSGIKNKHKKYICLVNNYIFIPLIHLIDALLNNNTVLKMLDIKSYAEESVLTGLYNLVGFKNEDFDQEQPHYSYKNLDDTLSVSIKENTPDITKECLRFLAQYGNNVKTSDSWLEEIESDITNKEINIHNMKLLLNH